MGACCAEARLHDLLLVDCVADLASFGGGRLDTVTFRRCRLREADLSDCGLERVLFERCDLAGADLTGAPCRDVELRGCELHGVRGIGGLRGAALTRADIVSATGALAAALGIGTLDD